jgi:hypothetical protein
MDFPVCRALLVLAILVLGAKARADTVRLRGGTEVRGTVLARDEKALHLLLPEGVELTLAAGDVAEVVVDDGAPKPGEAVRYDDRGEKGGALQVAVVTLVPPGEGPRVDLVGAVHIADRAFFHQVQALLERDDLVLYEMVKPRDADPEAEPAEGDNPLRDIQRRLGKWLDLTFQLDQISYDRPHFVHADLSPEDLFGGKPGEGAEPPLPAQVRLMLPLVKMALSVAERSMGGDSDQARKARTQLKGTMARMMGKMGSKVDSLLGQQMNEMLIERRNAVFYGAGHLPDLEKRLVADLGYRRAGAHWIDAWRVDPAP